MIAKLMFCVPSNLLVGSALYYRSVSAQISERKVLDQSTTCARVTSISLKEKFHSHAKHLEKGKHTFEFLYFSQNNEDKLWGEEGAVVRWGLDFGKFR